VGPRAGLDGNEKSRPYWDAIPGQSSPQRVDVPSTLPQPNPRREDVTRNIY